MEELLVNGIHAKSGGAFLAGLTLDDIARIAMGFTVNTATLPDLYGQSRRNSGDQKRSPVEGIEPDNLAQAGWGVIFAAGMDAEKEALQPLLALRREQAGDRYREFFGDSAFKQGENKRTFLKDRGAASTGPVEPGKMPFYLLLVGSPEQIPFEVQYELDIQYAVGRIHFDSVEDYSRYAKAVVAAETGTVTVPPRAAFVGVEHWWDPATRLSANRLVKPLASSLETARLDWAVETFCEEDAQKSNLVSLLQRDQPPALLFTASHGIVYDSDDREEQYACQGALLMQDFGGTTPVPIEECFTANDAKDLKTPGMISFHFACFGAGTPAENSFYGYSPDAPGRRKTLAPKPFLAALPKQMLANGALASVGHVDTAFATTFVKDASTAAYDSALKKLAAGGRIGLAMDYFNLRHAELSVGLTVALDDEQRREREVVADLAHRWLQNNDARNFIVVGDPAVRLPLQADPAVEAEQLRRQITTTEAELARLKARLQQLSGS